MNTFTLNGKVYNAREFDVNLICDLGDLGIDIMSGNIDSSKLLPILRGYLACCLHTTLDVAGNELQEHMINGGGIEEISNAMTKAMDESGFFRSIEKMSETTTSTRKGEKAKAEKNIIQ